MFASKQESILQYLYSIIFRFEHVESCSIDHRYNDLHSTVLDLDLNPWTATISRNKQFTFHYFRFRSHLKLYLLPLGLSNYFCRSLL